MCWKTTTRSERGFTLLEIMVTVAIVGVGLVPLLLIREQCTRQSMQARNANIVRTLVRELMSEIEFRGLEQLDGEFDGYPGFSYHVEIDEIDLITGEEDEDKNNPFGNDKSKYQPADVVWGTEAADEVEQQEYPARRVRLTLMYPNLKENAGDEPSKLLVETILPPLPLEDQPFETKK